MRKKAMTTSHNKCKYKEKNENSKRKGQHCVKANKYEYKNKNNKT